MLKTLNQLYKERLQKQDEGERWITLPGGRHVKIKESSEDAPKEKPKAKFSDAEKDRYYIRLKQGDFGNKSLEFKFNKKIGEMEGKARAYRVRASKMKEGERDPKGRTKNELLVMSKKLYDAASVEASKRDSLRGKPPVKKMMKQDLTEQDIIDMLNSGEFDEQIFDEIEEETGIDLRED